MYNLSSLIVHIGASPNSGHYISIGKCNGTWEKFDDDSVTVCRPFDYRH